MPGASEQRLPSRHCPPRHSRPLSPFWGPQPWPWHWLAQGSRDGDQERPSGPETWPSLAAARPSLQEQPGPAKVPMLPSGPPVDPGRSGRHGQLSQPHLSGPQEVRGSGEGLACSRLVPSPVLGRRQPGLCEGPQSRFHCVPEEGAPSLGCVGMRTC